MNLDFFFFCQNDLWKDCNLDANLHIRTYFGKIPEQLEIKFCLLIVKDEEDSRIPSGMSFGTGLLTVTQVLEE